MNQDITNNSNKSIDNSILRAERAVENSISKFEAAMEHLAEKAEVTSQRLQHVREVGKRSKDQLVHLKDEVSSTIQPVMPYMSRARSMSRGVATGAKQNSRPIFLSAVGLLGGYLFYRYFLQGKFQSPGVGVSSTTTYAGVGSYSTGQSADQFENLSYPR